MARRIIWTSNALEDLDAIAAYIARTSPMTARSVIDRLWSASQELGDYPHAWRRVDDLIDRKFEYRERIVMSWRMVYRVEPHTVRVMGIVHGRRDFGREQDRFEEPAQAEYVTS